MVAARHMAQLLEEFEASDADTATNHHEDNPSAHNNFMKDVNSLVQVIDESGNLFRRLLRAAQGISERHCSLSCE